MPHNRSSESQSAQDFLKAVYALQHEGERVSTNVLAEALSISAPSVTDMASRLSAAGLIDHRKYHGARLTEAGKQVAEQIIQRHELIEEYLVRHLGLSPNEAHQEAEQMEHAVSNRFMNALADRLNDQVIDSCAEAKASEVVLLLHEANK